MSVESQVVQNPNLETSLSKDFCPSILQGGHSMFYWNYISFLIKTNWEDTVMEAGICLLINSELCNIYDFQILLKCLLSFNISL